MLENDERAERRGVKMVKIYTIGHSSHTAEHFTGLLKQHGIEVLVDTRSAPYSRYSPQFDRESLRELVLAAGVKYLYLGDVIGGRPKDESHYDEQGRARYAAMGKGKEFLQAIARLEKGAADFRVALMCSEEDPAHCHRRLLVGRVIVERGAELLHIRGDGQLQEEAAVAAQSGKEITQTQPALFSDIDEDKWRSTASVSLRNRQNNSLVH
jgi:uncharacterized protein (DUF488 family)